jgi:nuclear pore complex protein Nup160
MFSAPLRLLINRHFRKRETLTILVNRMCEENAVQSLLDFNFAGLSDEVEAILSFKARNVDPRMKPSYSKILYSWYMSRGDYRNGGLV